MGRKKRVHSTWANNVNSLKKAKVTASPSGKCLKPDADSEKNVSKLQGTKTIQQKTDLVRFIDTYHKGLDGAQAAWAIKKYCGHRVLPDNIMHLFDSDSAAAPLPALSLPPHES
ncbi:hypothetical protein OG21DRAFT_152630 [Imleria badia]|nr:hypothetical protein OG21DRAFT_152630 [Imleria badia]